MRYGVKTNSKLRLPSIFWNATPPLVLTKELYETHEMSFDRGGTKFLPALRIPSQRRNLGWPLKAKALHIPRNPNSDECSLEESHQTVHDPS
jgi:hypothetical protein